MDAASRPVDAFVNSSRVGVAHASAGPLSGLSFAVKDIFDVAGHPTGCGSPEKRAENAPARAHAPVVATLLAAGARFAGKTHTAELAFSLDGRNSHYGTPVNPAAPGRVPGGSSSGSASAVAAGRADFALGSDTGGSVRGPASFCGLVGLRPTHGRIDIGGTMPLAPSLDTVGWFTRDLDLFRRVGVVVLGRDTDGPALRRVLMPDDAWALLSGREEDAALRPAAARFSDYLAESEPVVVAPDGLAEWREAFRTIQGFEAWRAHGPWIEQRKPDLMPAVRSRFEAARKVTVADYRAAETARTDIRARLADLVADDAVLVLPTLPTIAPRVDADEATFEEFRGRALSMLCMAGLAGFPQLSLPLATVHGCPLGLSLIGPPGRDRALIALARAVLAN